MPRPGSCRISSASSAVSASLSPAPGSSSSSRRGAVASATARPRRRRLPNGSRAGRLGALSREARRSQGSLADATAARRRHAARRAPGDAARSRAPSAPGTTSPAGTSAPGRGGRSHAAGWPAMSAALPDDPPGARAKHAGDDVEQRRLARPVRSDDAEDLRRGVTERSTPASATTPPKRLRRPLISSAAIGLTAPGQAASAARSRAGPARRPRHRDRPGPRSRRPAAAGSPAISADAVGDAASRPGRCSAPRAGS